MSAVVLVGFEPDGLFLEVFQPACVDHDPPWYGAPSFDLDTAKLNARVHNADRHHEEQGAAR